MTKIVLSGCALVLVCILLCGGCTAMYGLSTVNQEVTLRNQVQAKSKTNQAALDTMVKIIAQKCQVSGEWAKTNKEVIADIVEGRKGGMLFKAATEANQSVTPELFASIMNSIEGERKHFLREQTQLVDYIRERQALIDSPVSGTFLRVFGTITKFLPRGDADTPADYAKDYQYTWVTSSATKTMVATGEENDTRLDFGNTPKPAEKK